MDEVNANQFELSTRFNYSQAIVWQIKFIISCFLSKKALGAASAELQYVSPSRNILFLIHDGVIDFMRRTNIESMLTFLLCSCPKNLAPISTNTSSRSWSSKSTLRTPTRSLKTRTKPSRASFLHRNSAACA